MLEMVAYFQAGRGADSVSGDKGVDDRSAAGIHGADGDMASAVSVDVGRKMLQVHHVVLHVVVIRWLVSFAAELKEVHLNIGIDVHQMVRLATA